MQFKPYKFKKFVVLEINVFTPPDNGNLSLIKGQPGLNKGFRFCKRRKRDRFQVKFMGISLIYMREIDTKNGLYRVEFDIDRF